MTHYDFISLISGCLFVIIAFGILSAALASRNWKQADQMLHETMDSISPLHSPQVVHERIVWDAVVLMEHCQQCQDDSEQTL